MSKKSVFRLCLFLSSVFTTMFTGYKLSANNPGRIIKTTEPSQTIIFSNLPRLIGKLSLLAENIPGNDNAIAILDKIEKIISLLEQLKLSSPDKTTPGIVVQASKLRAHFFELSHLIFKHCNYLKFRRFFWQSINAAERTFSWPKNFKARLWQTMLLKRGSNIWTQKIWRNIWLGMETFAKIATIAYTIYKLTYWLKEDDSIFERIKKYFQRLSPDSKSREANHEPLE